MRPNCSSSGVHCSSSLLTSLVTFTLYFILNAPFAALASGTCGLPVFVFALICEALFGAGNGAVATIDVLLIWALSPIVIVLPVLLDALQPEAARLACAAAGVTRG